MNYPGRSIVLIGMMGAGKSSVGRWLQRRTGLDLLDTDQAAASKLGMSIREIFAQHGEARFRELETAALRELPLKSAVIVTGGGIVLRPENIALLQKLGTIVWLDGDEEILFERATRRGNRPLLETENPRAAFSKLLEARKSLYAKIAEVRIDTSRLGHDEVAKAILNRMEELSRR